MRNQKTKPDSVLATVSAVKNPAPRRPRPPLSGRRGAQQSDPLSSSPIRGKERPNATWIAGLLVLPLLAAGVTVSRIGTRYEGTVIFSIAPRAVQQHAADRSAPSLDVYRRELVDLVWWSSAARLTGAGNQPFTWTVQADLPQHRLCLRVITDTAAQTRRRLDTLAGKYAERLGALAESHVARLEADARLLHERKQGLEAAIAELDRVAGNLSSTSGGADPLQELLAACDEQDEQRRHFEVLRRRLTDALAQRGALRRAPAPTTAVVDPETRRQAYHADLVLQEDLHHLEVQLAQVRSAMLRVWQAASGSLDDLLVISEGLSRLCESPETAAAATERRVLLERIAEHAAHYHRQTTAFAQDWTRIFIGLRSLEIDPAKGEVLKVYDTLTRGVADYEHEAAAALASMRLRVRAMSERSEGEARSHVLTNVVIRRFHRLVTAQHSFQAATADLLERNNYLLAAALHSARGLRHRSETNRQALDAKLEEAARQRAVRERTARIDALSAQIDEWRTAADVAIEGMLATQERIHRDANEMPLFLTAAMAREIARGKRDVLAAQLEQINRELAEASSQSPVPMDPAAVQVVEQSVNRRPANLPSIVTSGLLAWCLTSLALLGFARVRKRDRVSL